MAYGFWLAATPAFAFDRVGRLSRPFSVVDPGGVSDDLVVVVDRLDQGGVKQLASRFLAIAALSDPGLGLAPDD